MNESHIPHADLVAAADGELSAARTAEVRAHLSACWTCRARSKEIEDTIASFVHAHQASVPVPPADAPTALLKVRLAELAALGAPTWQDRVAEFFLTGNRLAYTGAGMAVAAGVLFVVGVFLVSKQTYRLMPDPKLTPGSTVEVDQKQLCGEPERHATIIPASVGRQVFDRYGIDRPKARAYELDRLIAPELGGSDDDPKNFWPQPYTTSEWNAHVKDALEDHLHQLVCENKVDLATAQHDISSNWIAAYKKYFQTQEPIASHRAFTKDTPWEP